MRKLLLFTCVISFLTVASCSREEESTQVSVTEKEYLVKQTIIEFNNSAIKTGKYEAFIGDVSQKSTTTPLSQAELEVMLQEFLGDQTQAFLEVYHQLEALNITDKEFYSIASQFEYLRLDIIKNLSKSASEFCGANTGTLLRILISWVNLCEEE
ncbi:hypothetical protein [Aquimarina spinulae]|uniref:hypothetical protein n=1 Tax=Aquimarina spinulae TaxID=1192023 RepID=UPI000D54C520|nr:hypothetical protein [Aquimarina spinulae]